MESISLSGMRSWGNFIHPLPGAHGLSPCHGGGLRASFLLRFRREEGQAFCSATRIAKVYVQLVLERKEQ
jgi:hypothetical protein